MSAVINIAKSYTKTPGGRYISEGPFSGEDFRKKVLMPAIMSALKDKTDITIVLDGGFGYAPSFLEEAFGGLMRELKDSQLISLIHIISDEEPVLIKDIATYMKDALEGK